MNRNIVFAPTARTERFIKAHAANATTYALLLVVIVLTALQTVFTFAIEQIDRVPEYQLRAQLAKVRLQRSVLNAAIAVASFIAYHGLDTHMARIPGTVGHALDTAFCLGSERGTGRIAQ